MSSSFYVYEESQRNTADADGSLVRWRSDNSLNVQLPPNAAPETGRGAVALEPRDLLKRKLKTHVSMVNLTTGAGHQRQLVVDVTAVPCVQPGGHGDSRSPAEDEPQSCHRRQAFGGSSEAIMYLSQNEMDQSLNRIFGEPKYGGDIRRRTNSHGNDSLCARRRRNRNYRPSSLNVFAYAVRTSTRAERRCDYVV